MDTSTDAIIRRIEKLEHRNTRLKAGLIATVLAVGALFLTGAAQIGTPQSVTAQSFILVDANGNPRARLGMTDVGPALRFYDAAHNNLASLGIVHNMAAILALYDANTAAPRVLLASEPNGAGVSVNGTKGYADLGIETDGTPSFELRSGSAPHQQTVAKLMLGKDGEPVLKLGDVSGHVRLALGESALTNKARGGETDTPVSTITAFDKKGNVIRKWP